MIIRGDSQLSLANLTLDGDGKAAWSTRQFLFLEPDATDFIHRICDGDFIDAISFKYYGTVNLWWAIADVNNIACPLDLQVGAEIRIPQKSRLEAAIKNARTI